MELSNLTPEDYGLKVRTHPNGLNITAANKIRNGTRMQVTFSGQLSQTTVFQKDKNIQEHNFIHTQSWLDKLGKQTRVKNDTIVWEEVNSDKINLFLTEFRIHPVCRKAETDLLIKYIKMVNEKGELSKWTVALVSSNKPKNTYTINGYDIGLIQRTDATQDTDLYILKNANILNPPDQHIDFTDEERERALSKTIEAWNEGKSRAKNIPNEPSGPYIRSVRPPEKGLLLIYPLDNNLITLKEKKFTNKPIIGFAISFPKGLRDEVVEYQVNTRYWQDRFGELDDDS